MPREGRARRKIKVYFDPSYGRWAVQWDDTGVTHLRYFDSQDAAQSYAQSVPGRLRTRSAPLHHHVHGGR